MRTIESQQSKVVHLDNAVHHGGQRDLSAITLIAMHATADKSSGMASIRYLNTTDEKKASYHLVIERSGQILRMLPIESVAWHAGDSAWPSPQRYPPGNGGHSVNSFSIGISFANDNESEDLTDEQITSGLWLCHYYMNLLRIPPSRVVSHADVSPGRKTDPAKMRSREWRQLLADSEIAP